ncbi:cell wall protein Ecm33, variant 2 [Clarireedia jacksonii]
MSLNPTPFSVYLQYPNFEGIKFRLAGLIPQHTLYIFGTYLVTLYSNMYFKKTSVRSTYWLLLAFVCLISPAYCQTTNVCGDIGATRTISSQADATVLANCSIVAGSIALATAVAGNIDLNGVQEILENLIVEDVRGLIGLSGESLKQINGNFNVNNVTTLSSLDFPLLTAVDTIEFVALPAVSAFNFTSGLSSVSNVFITNTFLSSLDGINLQNADIININNNNRMKDISLPLETVKSGIYIDSNSLKPVINLPQLTSSGNISLGNISSIQLPSLNFISGTFNLRSTSVGEFAVDALSVIGIDLILYNNSNLTNTSFQGLLSAGTIKITNNSALNSISFEKLSQAGNVSIAGNLTR